MSIAGGIENAYYNGASIDCMAIQIFTHSNRQWAIKPLSDETKEKVKKAQQETGISHAMVHGSYLINLASTDTETRKKSKHMLEMEIRHCADLGIKLLVLHPGSNPSLNDATILISDALNDIFERDTSPVTVLLENMAGQGSQIGRFIEQLATLKDKVSHKKRLGFCIDTCHLWAAGYDFSDPKKYSQVWTEIDQILGIENIRALHLNDSKQSLNAQVDRHANIGQGTIGLEAFRLIMNDPKLHTIPKILETPGKELYEYAHNMTILRNLAKN